MYIVKRKTTNRKVVNTMFPTYERARQFARTHIRKTNKNWKAVEGQITQDSNPFIGYHGLTIQKAA